MEGGKSLSNSQSKRGWPRVVHNVLEQAGTLSLLQPRDSPLTFGKK
jgi:hypothetical protein